MAVTVARLEAVLGANTREFDRAMSRSEGRMHKVGRAAGVAGGLLAGGLAVGIASSVKEAIQAEKVNTRLEQSYKRGVKGGIEPYRKEIEKAGKAAVNLGFDDEDLKDSLGSLIIATHSNRKAQELANVAMDVARFKNVDLQAATKTLTMAMAGSQRAAKQLGIQVSAVTTEQDKAKKAFNDAKDAIEAHYKAMGKLTPAEEAAKKAALDHAKAQYEGAKAAGQVADKQATAGKVIDATKKAVQGQADTYAKTAEGQMKVFQEKTDNLKEHLGTLLLPVLGKVVDKLIKMADWLEKNPKVMKGMVIGLGFLAGALLAAAAAQTALNLAVLANPYAAAVLLLVAFYGAVFILYKKFKELRPEIEFFLETVLGLPLPLRLALAALGGIHGTIDKLRGPVMKLADAFHTLWNFLEKIIDAAKWLAKHLPDIPDVHIPFLGGSSSGAKGQMQTQGMQAITQGVGGGHAHVVPQVAMAVGYATMRGWRGGVTSAFRTYGEQSALYQRYLAGGPLAAKPGTSSHEKGLAVDVGDPGRFGAMMSQAPGFAKLFNRLGSRDPVHYSVSGYDRGGWLPPGLSMAWNGTGRPEPVGMGDINLYVDGHKLFSWLQNAGRKDQRRNGRGF